MRKQIQDPAPPRTYAAPPPPKFILNPEWEKSEKKEEEVDKLIDDAVQFGGAPFGEVLDTERLYAPERYGVDIGQGMWVQIKKPPMTEYTVPPGSIWYALPDHRNGRKSLPQKWVRIITPAGQLRLHPREYMLVKDIKEWLQFPEDHVRIHMLGGAGVNSEKLFYLRSRGIGKADAIKMLIGDVKSQDVLFMTIHPGYAAIFGWDENFDQSRNAVKEPAWITL